jgi:hypothetical protein
MAKPKNLSRGRVKKPRGRKALRIEDGFGRAVYEAMIRQRREDGQAWGVGDLVRAMRSGPNAPSSWIRGVIPKGATLGRLADKLGCSADALLKGRLEEIYLINLPDWMQQAVRDEAARRGTKIADHARGVKALVDEANQRQLRGAGLQEAGVGPR